MTQMSSSAEGLLP